MDKKQIAKIYADFKCVTKKHKMKIISDVNNIRCIEFATDGTFCGRFTLTTWPQHLCISGDYGTFVFSRTEDMFRFFRKDKGLNAPVISPHYWGEKLQSESRFGGYKEFSEKTFLDVVKEEFKNFCNNYEVKGKKKALLWDMIQDDVLSSETEEQAYRNTSNFEFEIDGDKKQVFQDFWENKLTDYTFHYIWCLYAIVWGISEYDKAVTK